MTFANKSVIRADTQGFGDAGNVLLQGDTLTLKEGARVDVNTGRQTATTGKGHGGTLTITAKKAILIDGQDSAQ
ncbi:hypothetical protein QUF54_01040 [Candidatus Marithioploca araucensis]|uniref:Uncharacterized protein n=1 Tax=Candidatus Marithioploca araucensis TaxID=70273 RepID=A0ABT7VQH9_9GAMM|nr:hypothetical protein [Candidatus Marithioploca araucensis]